MLGLKRMMRLERILQIMDLKEKSLIKRLNHYLVEKNMLQLAKVSGSQAGVLLLDEPTSHLDTYSQIALEKAIEDYKGAILMISHDFYSVVNGMDYVLIIDDKTISQMSMQEFRQMIYASHFDKDYLETEQQKNQLK